jgi:G3E family GTPase
VSPSPAPESIPVTILTGFLGSGKTTLLRRALSSPAFADTAVIINEVGEIAIDHYLVDFVDGAVLELPGGCLCCAMREDLAQTLRALIERRDAGDIRAFRRIVVETSGLADPGPILYTLGADPTLDQRLRLHRVVTVVDAVAGATTLERFAEAARQAAVADTLIISKTDLAPFGEPLAARLDALNLAAERVMGAAAADPASLLFGEHDDDPKPHKTVMPGLDPGIHEVSTNAIDCDGVDGRDKPSQDDDNGRQATHSHGVVTFAIVLGGPVGRFEFARAFGGLAQERGYDLLRVKGIVGFADAPDRPAVVQAAQHAMYTPRWLDDWPDDDRRSRLVFIVHDISPDEILDRFAFASPSLSGPRASGPHAGGTPALPSQP